MNQKQAKLTCVLAVLLVITMIVSYLLPKLIEQDEIGKMEIAFSIPSGFYGEELNIQLSATEAGEIYYTLDGSNPAEKGENTKHFLPEEGIVLDCSNSETVYTIKAIGIPQKGKISGVYTQTYIVGKNVNTRYENPVLSLVGDFKELLQEDTGILSMQNRELRGKESEREVHATLFDTDGSVILQQNCGVRVSGATSRMKNQPSLKLYARSEYDKKNEFNCALYADYTNVGTLVTGSKRVVARNGGSDNGYAHLRSEFVSRLSAEAGFEDIQSAAPICVYVNGEYYGAYWFVEIFDDSYFEKKYGEYDGRMLVMDNNIAYLEPEEEDDELTLQIKEEYGNLYQMLSQADLQDERNWQLLNDTIDVENFLKYMALQNYFCNRDNLVNNFKTYRYYAVDGEYVSGTVFDGRYRFLLYDMDETLGWGAYDEPGAEASILTTANCVGYDIFYNALFNNIVKTRAGRDFYIKYYLSLANYYCEEGHAGAVLDEMHESREKELQIQYAETNFAENSFETPEEIDYEHVLYSLGIIKNFLKERPAWALRDLEEAFSLGNPYTLFLQNPGEAYITVDYASFYDKEFTGAYYEEVPTVMTAEPKLGDKFEYWLVDGVEYYDPTLIVSGDMFLDESMYIECVTSKDPDAGIYITGVKSRGGSDYVELTNFSSEEEDLSRYTLSDDSDRERASTLPSVMVEPGQTITVYCKNYTGAEAIGQPEVNFNIKKGETLHLFRKQLIQKVSVPKMGTKAGVYQIDIHSGKFYEKLQ